VSSSEPVLNSAFRSSHSFGFARNFVLGAIAVKFSSASPCVRLCVLCVLCVSAFSYSSSTSAQTPTPRPITIDDYFQIQAVHDPQLSSDGKWVAYSVDKSTLKTDKTETRIWMIPASGGDALPMTAEDVTSEHPRWSPKFGSSTAKAVKLSASPTSFRISLISLGLPMAAKWSCS
jgi:hypothetical protein